MRADVLAPPCQEHIDCAGPGFDPRHYGEPGCLFNPRVDLVDAFDEPAIQSLYDLATAMYAVARRLSELGRHGWVLDGPPDHGVFCTMWAGLGDPPIGDANTVDGLTIEDALSRII